MQYQKVKIAKQDDINMIDSIQNIIQDVNCVIEANSTLSVEQIKVINEKFKHLGSAETVKTEDKLSLISLASRIHQLESQDHAAIKGLEAFKKYTLAVLGQELVSDEFSEKIEKTLGKDSIIRKETLKAASYLINENMEPLKIIQILETVQKLSSGQRENVCEMGASFIKSSTNKIDMLHILEGIQKISPERREDICRRAKSFIPESMPQEDISDVLKALREIPPEEFKETSEAAARLINKHAQASTIECILKIVRQIPSGERDDVCEETRLFMNEDTRFHEIDDILEAVRQISSEKRGEVCSLSRIFIHKDTNASEIPQILEAVSKADTVASLLEALRQIPSEKRSEFFEIAEFFLDKSTTGLGISDVFKAILMVPQKERGEVCAQISEYWKNHPNELPEQFLPKIIYSQLHFRLNLPVIDLKGLRNLLLQNPTSSLSQLLQDNGYSPVVFGLSSDEMSNLLQSRNLDGMIFWGCQLSSCWRGNLRNIFFLYCDITSADFTGAILKECSFKKCEIKGSLFMNSLLVCVHFYDTRIFTSCFEDAIFFQVVFEKVAFSGSYFLGAKAEEVQIIQSDLINAPFLETLSMASKAMIHTDPIIVGLCSPNLTGISVPAAFKKLDTHVGPSSLRVPFQTYSLKQREVNGEVSHLLEEIQLNKGKESLPIPQQLLTKILENKEKYPNCAIVLERAQKLAQVTDAFFLPGGEDIPQALYSYEVKDKSGDYCRSLLELAIIRESCLKGIPLMCVCRGFQMMNIYCGAGLIQDVPDHLEDQLISFAEEEKFNGIRGSLISQALEHSIMGICRHHQGVSETALSQDLDYTSFYKGIAKSAEGKHGGTSPMILLQFHPEFHKDQTSDDDVIFQAYKKNDIFWKILSDSAMTYKAKKKVIQAMQP